MKSRWIYFIALRYIFRRRKKTPSPVLSILGIAVGVMALLIIIAVMNGFQLSFIESILEISSYHLRAGNIEASALDTVRETILKIDGVKSVIPFREFQALIKGKRGKQQAILVRAFPSDAKSMDASLIERLHFERVQFADEQSIVLGAELARRLMLGIGDAVSIFSISSIFGFDDEEENGSTGARTFIVSGLFESGYYEFDAGWAIININSTAAFTNAEPVLGIKLNNHFNDWNMLNDIKNNLAHISGFDSIEFSSWRDYNRSFFGALRTEKLFMFLLVGLIFIVVGLNIFQSQRRAVLEHREEIGLLRALGGSEKASRLIFSCGGAIIGFMGASVGVALGLLIANNIEVFFSIIENIANLFINIINIIAGFFDVSDVENFYFFSPAVFYIKEIPSRIIVGEVVLIFMFGFLSALIAAWFASRRVSLTRPAEVLRYE